MTSCSFEVARAYLTDLDDKDVRCCPEADLNQIRRDVGFQGVGRHDFDTTPRRRLTLSRLSASPYSLISSARTPALIKPSVKHPVFRPMLAEFERWTWLVQVADITPERARQNKLLHFPAKNRGLWRPCQVR